VTVGRPEEFLVRVKRPPGSSGGLGVVLFSRPMLSVEHPCAHDEETGPWRSRATAPSARRGVTDWITLNRSERLNALDNAMVDDLGALL